MRQYYLHRLHECKEVLGVLMQQWHEAIAHRHERILSIDTTRKSSAPPAIMSARAQQASSPTASTPSSSRVSILRRTNSNPLSNALFSLPESDKPILLGIVFHFFVLFAFVCLIV